MVIPQTVILRPIAGFEWPCPHCHAQNKIHEFTPCVVCPHCGLQANAQIEMDVLACLTEKECQILMLLAEGNTNGMIATKVELSPNTIRNYVSDIFDKLKVSNRSEASTLATRAMTQQPPRRK